MTTSYIEDSQLNERLEQSGVTVVDFTATWCGPCRLIAPFIDKLATEYGDRAGVFKLDIDKNKDSAKKYQIRSIPAVLYFKDGELVDKIIGKANYEQFAETLETHL